MWSRLVAYLRGLGRRRAIELEVDEELAFHVEQETEANIARGMSAVEARRVALRSLGGVTQTREAVGDVRRTRLDTIARDVRHAIRSLAATPAFTVVAVAILTLSIGATTAIYSVVDGVMLRALPFPEPNRLVAVGERRREASDQDQHLVAPQNFLDWRARQDVFTGLAAIGYASIRVRPENGHEPEVLQTQAVTADFFPVLGVAPLLGRAFTREQEADGRARVAVISYGLWQRRFGSAADVIGRSIPGQLGDLEIVGVMPPGFAYPVGAVRPTDVWIPSVFRPEERVRGNDFAYRLEVIGRLRDGMSMAAARARMDRITADLAAETPRWFEDRVASVERLDDHLTRGVRTWLLLLLAAVGCVLLIACVNLANLMLVRASARRRELAIRSALGASRSDLARILLIEALVLSLGGTALGVALAWAGTGLLKAAIPAEVPRVGSIAVDLRVLAAMAVVAVASGVLFSLVAVLQFSRPATGPVMAAVMRSKTATAANQWARGALVVLEVALAVVLLVGAGLFLASFARVANVNLGLETQDVLSVRIQPLVGASNWQLAQQRNRGLLDDVLRDVRRIPGVDGAALVSGGVPFRGDLRTIEFGIPGRVMAPDEDLDFNEVSPDYFGVLRVPLLRGRLFGDEDRHGSEPVVILNDAAVRRYFPGQDPIGRIVTFDGTRRVVGVVGNIRHEGPETSWRHQGFIPLQQSRTVGATLMVRLSGEMGVVLPAVKSAIWARFPELALPDVEMLSGYLGKLVAPRRFNMQLLSLFAGLAVVIACVGIYGVMAYTVTLRTQEIGIRLALGARPLAILGSAIGRALVYLVGGLVLGLTAASALASMVSGFLFETPPHDPGVYVGVAVLLLGTGLMAAFIPARRAARVDPLIALRVD
jgi:putative ABC transport system permease protein